MAYHLYAPVYSFNSSVIFCYKCLIILFLIFLRNSFWKYEGRFQSSWTNRITPSRNFVEVRCTSYNAPPTSRKLAADRWSLWNFLPRSSLFMVGKAQKSHEARSELNSVSGLEKMDRWNPVRTSPSRSRPMRFLGFSNHGKGAQRQEISKWSSVCSTFSRSGWSVVRSSDS
jgi:hypothetical protein